MWGVGSLCDPVSEEEEQGRGFRDQGSTNKVREGSGDRQ